MDVWAPTLVTCLWEEGCKLGMNKYTSKERAYSLIDFTVLFWLFCFALFRFVLGKKQEISWESSCREQC